MSLFPFGHRDALVSATCLSANDVGGAVVDNIGGDPDYNENGVLIPANSSIRFNSTVLPNISRLKYGAHISFDIQTGFIDRAFHPATNEILLYIAGSTGFHIRHDINTGTFTFGQAGVGAQKAELLPDNKGAFTNIKVSFDGGKVELFVNDYPVMSNPFNVDTTITDIYIGGSGSGSLPNPTQHRIKNFQIVNFPFSRPIAYGFEHFNVYGNSIVKLGQVGTVNLAQVAVIPDGSSGSTFDSIPAQRDVCMIPTMMREFAKNNIFVGGNRIHTWHQGGSGVVGGSTQLSARVNASLGAGFNVPTHSLFEMGVNDNTDVTVTLVSITNGSWRTAYEIEIDKVLNAGCRSITVFNVQPINVFVAGNTTENKDKNLALNDEIAAMVNSFSELDLADQYGMFGGQGGFNPADFGGLAGGADDQHPSYQGQGKLGVLGAQTSIKNVLRLL